MKNNVVTIDHPLIKRSISVLRDKNTNFSLFRKHISIISKLMVYKISENLSLKEGTLETPLDKAVDYKLKNNIILVPILRAALGMLDGFWEMIPEAQVGHIGIYRHKVTCEPVSYFCKLPKDISNSSIILLDPALATGESACAAIAKLKELGAENINFVSIISCKEGVNNVAQTHSEVKQYTACIDPILTPNNYISPGLGDAGDRYFGTI